MLIKQLNKHCSISRALYILAATEKKRLSMAICLALIGAMLEVLPWYLLYLGVAQLANYDAQGLMLTALWLALAILGHYLATGMALWQSHLAAYHIMQRLRQHIVSALANMRLRDSAKLHRADLEKRIIQDIDKLEPLFAHQIVELINGIILPLLLLGLLSWIDWRLALVAFVPLPAALLMQWYLMRSFPALQHQYNQSLAEVDQANLDFLRGLSVMKIYCQQPEAFVQLREALAQHQSLTGKFINQMVSSWGAFVSLAQGSVWMVLPLAAYLYSQQQLQLAAFVVALMLSAILFKPWLQLTQLCSQLIQAGNALERVQPLLGDASTTDSVANLVDKPSPMTVLTVKNLSLSLAGQWVYRQLNCEFFAGQRIVIVGKSGAGKSSFVQTLAGLYQADQGQVLIDQQAIYDHPNKSSSRLINLLNQQLFFFRGTVRDNLLLGAVDVPAERLTEVLDLTGVSTMLEQLPAGWMSNMGEAERQFSGGEQQRLAIARALLANTPVLILDEALSQLDTIAQQTLLVKLQKAFPKQLQIIISHRLNVCEDADQVLVLDKGVLIAQGTHAELLVSCPLYQQLYSDHFSTAKEVLHA